MKVKRLLIGMVLLALVLSGCAKSAAMESVNRDGVSMEQPVMAPAASESYAADSSKSGIASGTAEFQQMVIMNADLSIAVDDPSVSLVDIQKLAKEMGGFTVSSNLYKSQTAGGLEVPEATVTVRVPAEKLDEALAKIKALTGDAKKFTLSENVSGQDVTQEYTDLKSRLRNLEEADAKLSELYAKAEKTEDALAIYSQKMQVTEQIEIIKGQMQYYEQSSSKSAITVRLQAKASMAPLSIAGWQPSGVAKKALQALIDFGKGLVDFLIWLGIFILPVVLVIGLPFYFFIRWLVRRNRRKQAEKLEALKNSMRENQPPLPTR